MILLIHIAGSSGLFTIVATVHGNCELYLLNADCPNKVVKVINKRVEEGRPIPTNDDNWTLEDYENYVEQKKVVIL